MTRDYLSYKRLLKALLPTGRAWRADDPVRDGFLEGVATELARADGRVDDFMRERDTRTASELLGEHEDDFGIIPQVGATTAQRQTALNTRLRSLGGMTASYYIGVAAALGYTITIETYTPAWSGLMVSGDPCGDQENVATWKVLIPTSNAAPVYSYDDLVTALEPLKPVHTLLLFRVSGPGFSMGFNTGFSSMPAGSPVLSFSRGFSSGFGDN